jgi:hypothetical protein
MRDAARDLVECGKDGGLVLDLLLLDLLILDLLILLGLSASRYSRDHRYGQQKRGQPGAGRQN